MVNVKFIKALSYLSMLEDMTKDLRKSEGGIDTFTAYMRYMDMHKQFFPLIQEELLDAGRAKSIPVKDFVEPNENESVVGTILMDLDIGKGNSDYRYFLLNPEAVAYLDAQNEECEKLTMEEIGNLFPV